MGKAKIVVIALLVGYMVLRTQGCEMPKPAPVVPEVVVPVEPVVPEVVMPEVDEPTLVYKTMVSAIVDVEFEKDDAIILSEYFTTLATIVANDGGIIKSTSNLREYIVKSGSLTFSGTDMNDKYTVGEDSFGKHINTQLANAIGKENVTIDVNKRTSSAEFFNAVGWAVTK